MWGNVPAVLWSRRTWPAVAGLLIGAVLWLVPAALTMTIVGAGMLIGSEHPPPGLGGSEKLGGTVGGTVPLVVVLPVLLALTFRFTVWHQARLRLLGADLAPPAARPPGMSRRSWLARQAVSATTWRQVRYHALGGAFLTAAGVVVLAGLVFGPGFVVAAALSGKGSLLQRSPIAALGVGMAVAAGWLARGAAALDLALARRLLQPPAAELLARRVAALSASRAAVVEAADAERRRIERDLHDGTQQRLVSLAMNLGMTRAAVADADPAVRAAVAAAHEEAKQALAELRDLIRGLYPAVLDELGLDAALSGIAARSPVPVRLVVDLRGRPPAPIEAVAYFVVSEALSNVAKHAAATRADVVVRQQPGGLTLAVADDGRGGADPVRGTGLRGLRQRVESVDGTLSIASPAGGPTSIRVSLPCG
ncbi:histidine kinase [Actinoplanes sp. SE50]|nr:histidine kinase [Actinoplanes sp. SE50/110]ATO79430.1 histidine kinase [Actinoplanes sp. SE50]SLL96830.1 two-component sensor histidine kinase [Actinoplanes sp. SE50/110]